MNDLDHRDSFTGVFAEAGAIPEVAKFHPFHACVHCKGRFWFDVLMEIFELKQKIAQGDLHLPVDIGEMRGFNQPVPGKSGSLGIGWFQWGDFLFHF